MKSKSLNRGLFVTALFIAIISSTSYGLIFDIDYTGMSSDAEAACGRAAAKWEAVLTDVVTVNISMSMASLNEGILGTANTTMQNYGFDSVIRSMINDATTSLDNTILGYLPTSSDYKHVEIEYGNLSTSLITLTQANVKAISSSASYNGPDSSITFSSGMTWDYNNSNGVLSNAYDLESVALHELGHALGFTSSLDSTAMQNIQNSTGDSYELIITPMDLFRFNGDYLPTSLSAFTDAKHDITPGGADYFYTGQGNIPLSNGNTYQASHLQDDLGLGIMDPTLGFGETSSITANDLAVMDLIGWDVIPEPATLGLVLVGFIAINFKPKRKTV